MADIYTQIKQKADEFMNSDEMKRKYNNGSKALTAAHAVELNLGLFEVMITRAVLGFCGPWAQL